MELTLEDEHSNNSMPNLSKQNLIDKHNSVLTCYRKLQAEEEERNQQVYNCKRELTRLKTLEVEYISEIESLQLQKGSECENLKCKIQDLENKRNDLHYQHAQHIKKLQQTVCIGNEQIGKLRNELELIINISNSNNEKSKIDELNLKNTEFKNEILNLQSNIMILRNKIDYLEKQNLIDTEQKENIQEDFNTLNEHYKYINKDIHEAKQLNESLQEDLILSKQELDTVKCEPLRDGSQGNSLFAEVDNKRLELEERMSLMESQYLKMKNDHAKLLSEIATLNSTNAILCQKWETELKDNVSDVEIVKQGYMEQIKLLETQLQTCINKISSAQKITSTNFKPGEIQFMVNMLEAKDREFVEVLRQGEDFSQSRILISHELGESNRKIRTLRAKATKNEFEIGKLQAVIEDLKLKQAQVVIPLKSKKSILKDVGNAIAYLNSVDGFSMIDYSRQLKRSRMKSDRISKSIASIGCEVSKNDLERKVETRSLNNMQKDIDTAENSDIDLKGEENAVTCKPVVLKKKC